jgi:lysophospholipase L1-like esterase
MIKRLLIALVLIGIGGQAHASSNGILTQGLSSSTSSSGGSTSLSALTSGTATNSIDSTMFGQTWNWSTLSTGTALSLTASGLTTGTVLNLSATTSGVSGNAALFSLTGTGSTGYALYLQNTNPTNTAGAALGVNGPVYYTPTGTGNFQRMMGGFAELPHWHKAITGVINGQNGSGPVVQARVLFIGDSTTMGSYCTTTVSQQTGCSFPSQLAAILNAHGINATTDSFVGDALNTAPRYLQDPRMSLGAGWVDTNLLTSTIGGDGFVATGVTSGPLTYTPSLPVDTFKVLYLTNGGQGTLSYNIDGASNATINENAAASFAAVTTGAGTVGNHVINFNNVSGSANVWVLGAEAWDSTRSQVIIENAGWNSSTSANWASTSNAWSPALACGILAPDLVVIDLGINDMQVGVALSTFKSNLQSLISHCQSAGHTDVLLVTTNHTNPSDSNNPTSEATQQTYAQTVRALSQTTTNSANIVGVPLADEFSNLSSYAQELVAGYPANNGSYPDDLHLLGPGNSFIARDLFSLLVPGGDGAKTNLSNQLWATTSGNVGIGTKIPATPLDVNGDITMETGTGGSVLCLTSTHSMGHCTAAASCTSTCTCTCQAN